MDRKLFIETLFARAKEQGAEQCEAFYSAGSSFDAEILKGEVVSYSASDSCGLGFRVMISGRMGYASTQVLDEEAVDLLVNSAITNAKLIDSADEQFLYDGSGEYAEMNLYDPSIDGVSAADKLAVARQNEQKTMAKDSRVTQVQSCEVFSEAEECAIVNTLGLNVSSKVNVMGGAVGPVAKDGDKVSNAFGIFLADGADWSDADRAIDESVKQATDYLYAESVPSGEYPVIFRYDAMRSLLQTFIGVFSADSAQKGFSLLKGKEGRKIAAECVTLVDDPLMEKSVSSSPFDGEGVPTRYKEVVKNGTLTTLLHNLKTAHKQGVASTGNASRPSYSSPVGIAPTNFFVAPGEDTLDTLCEKMGDGVVICNLQGLHAGANAVSGDFSLGAKGYRVQGGKIVGAVKEITVAGNFYRLLENVVCVGSDLRFGFPGSSRFGSPSVLVKPMSVAGK